ncbi:MAG: ATP-binding protein [Bacteroidaceae bacterium]|nr:ATP-binding protein [Bacteroidaceae bacterium]
MNLQRLIAEGEHQQQDFKFEITSACKIARSLSAFANTDGGRLLIGVKDNGAIAGVRSDEEMYMVEAAGEVWCNPPVHCRMTAYRVGVPSSAHETRTVVIAEVDPAMQRPVCARLEDGSLRAFIRIADENIMASPVRMALWRSETASNGALLPLTDEELSLLHLFRQPSNDKLVSGEGLEVRAKAGVANNSSPSPLTPNPSPLTPNPSPLTLNQFCRRARVPRFRAVRLLATFIRFGLVEEVFQNHAFVYRAII